MRYKLQLNQIDLIVPDVPAAATFFHEVLGLPLVENSPRFAQLEAGAVSIMLSPDALVSVEPAQGIILHFQVANVAQALAQARQRGANVLWGPQVTDWNTESAIIEGPGGIRIDFYCPVET